LKPSKQQKTILDEWINTSNYVYNKTVEAINKGTPIHFQTLRDKLVTNNTKKHNLEYQNMSSNILTMHQEKKSLMKRLNELKRSECSNDTLNCAEQEVEDMCKRIADANALLRMKAKTMKSSQNVDILPWELNTPKEVRAAAVNDVCKAFKTGFSNLKLGHIKHFRMGYRKHKESHKSVCIPSNFLNIQDGNIVLAPRFFGEHKSFTIGKKCRQRLSKKKQQLSVNNDSRIIKKFHEYWIFLPIQANMSNDKKRPLNFCGVDPGVRTFMTTVGNNGVVEYQQNKDLLQKLNAKIDALKLVRKHRVRKKDIQKREQKKHDIVDELHWKTIQHLLNTHDAIMYGDIKSHDIVKGGKNSTLNRDFEDMRFYVFKQRLLYKAKVLNKLVVPVNEAYTTKTCSGCGALNEVGCSKVFTCSKCSSVYDRDINAAKNILIKGITMYL